MANLTNLPPELFSTILDCLPERYQFQIIINLRLVSQENKKYIDPYFEPYLSLKTAIDTAFEEEKFETTPEKRVEIAERVSGKLKNLPYHRLVAATPTFQEFIFSYEEHLLILSKEHEFLALKLLENPLKFFNALHKHILQKYEDSHSLSHRDVATALATHVAKNHESSSLFLLKHPAFNEFLLDKAWVHSPNKNISRRVTRLEALVNAQPGALLSAIEGKTFFKRLNLDTITVLFQKAPEEIILTLCQNEKCVKHVKSSFNSGGLSRGFFMCALNKRFNLPILMPPVDEALSRVVRVITERKAVAASNPGP